MAAWLAGFVVARGLFVVGKLFFMVSGLAVVSGLAPRWGA